MVYRLLEHQYPVLKEHKSSAQLKALLGERVVVTQYNDEDYYTFFFPSIGELSITSVVGFHYLGTHYDGGQVEGTWHGKTFFAKYREEGTHDDRFISTRDRAWVEGDEVEDFPFDQVKDLALERR